MALQIIRILDRVKIDQETIERLVFDHIERETGRKVQSGELHIERSKLTGDTIITHATVYLTHKD